MAEHIRCGNDNLMLSRTIIRNTMATILPSEDVSPTDPKHAIDIVVDGWEATIGDLERTLYPKLFAFNFEDLTDLLTQLAEEAALGGIVYYGSDGPHRCVLENHIKALSDLVWLAGWIVDSLSKRILLGHNRHNLEHTRCDLIFLAR